MTTKKPIITYSGNNHLRIYEDRIEYFSEGNHHETFWLKGKNIRERDATLLEHRQEKYDNI